MSNGNSDLVEVNVTFLYDGDGQIKVEDANGKTTWLPKREISEGWEEDKYERNDALTLSIPEWLAVDRGLV